MSSKLEIPEAKGTPIAMKTPINFKAKREKMQKNNDVAMRKLVLTSILTMFFIVI